MELRRLRLSGSISRFLVPASALALAGLLACSGDSPASSAGPDSGGGGADSGACAAYAPPPTFDPTTPAVSFTNDVFPVFAASCAFSDCHGSLDASEDGLYLGADVDAVYKGLVNVASENLPSMPLVKPGTPGDSFLLYKLDGDACTLAGCSSGTCSALMPDGNPTPLDEATRLTIRAWIAQGALSDAPHAGADDGGSDSGEAGAGDAAPGEAGDAGDAGPSDAGGADGETGASDAAAD